MKEILLNPAPKWTVPLRDYGLSFDFICMRDHISAADIFEQVMVILG